MKLPVSLSIVYILSPARTQWDLKGEKIKKILQPPGLGHLGDCNDACALEEIISSAYLQLLSCKKSTHARTHAYLTSAAISVGKFA